MRHLRSELTHPTAGQRPIGFTRQGRPVWPIAGGADDPPDGPPADPPKDPPADPPNDPKDPPKDPAAKGFPENTPLTEMTVEQREAYWKDKARKHEERANARADYDAVKAKADQFEQLQRSQMSDQDKAVEDARSEARSAALREVGARLVDAEIRAVSAGRLSDEQRTVLIDGLDRTRFLTDDGEVDTDKVTAYIDGIAPATGTDPKPPLIPDLGQGRRPGRAQPSVAAGRDLFAQSRSRSGTDD